MLVVVDHLFMIGRGSFVYFLSTLYLKTVCTGSGSFNYYKSYHNNRMSTDVIPRIRSPLGRALYYRLRHDAAERNADHSFWYTIQKETLPTDIVEKFVQMKEDEETVEFLDNCYEKADWLFTQIYHRLVTSILGWFVTKTSINGLLGRGSMFVFSNQQFQELLSIPTDWRAARLLDLGAGDGRVTEKMADHFDEVYVTEMSKPMTWRLAKKKYILLGVDDWYTSGQRFDLISCLNLLDRCDRPITLLGQIRQSLHPVTGRLLLALVLPLSPYNEFSKTTRPSEHICLTGRSFEEQVKNLVKTILEPAGFELVHFTRLPYLCEGDLERSFYILTDSVLVLKPSENNSTLSTNSTSLPDISVQS